MLEIWMLSDYPGCPVTWGQPVYVKTMSTVLRWDRQPKSIINWIVSSSYVALAWMPEDDMDILEQQACITRCDQHANELPEKVLDRPDQIRGRIWSGRSYWTRSLGRSGRSRPVPDRSSRN
jgi:hypothetical protein